MKFFILVLLWSGFFFAIWLIYIYKTLPDIHDYNNKKRIITIRYDNGEIIHEFNKRHEVTYNQIPKHFIDALIVTEDINFWTHGGFDHVAIVRAFYKNFKSGKIVQGGSTITQQLAKVVFLNSRRKYIRKIRELLLAIKLESVFTKEQILTLYLNNIYFGGGNYGISQASRSYFNVEVKDLNLWQSAILVAVINAPSILSPYRNNSETKIKANRVI